MADSGMRSTMLDHLTILSTEVLCELDGYLIGML
jgi:hypothetical protein